MSQGQRVYVSKSDAPQKIERRQVDGNEQSILAEPTQREIHTRPSKAQTFSFAVARHEGNFQQYT
jgi:hypothetical protein